MPFPRSNLAHCSRELWVPLTRRNCPPLRTTCRSVTTRSPLPRCGLRHRGAAPAQRPGARHPSGGRPVRRADRALARSSGCLPSRRGGGRPGPLETGVARRALSGPERDEPHAIASKRVTRLARNPQFPRTVCDGPVRRSGGSADRRRSARQPRRPGTLVVKGAHERTEAGRRAVRPAPAPRTGGREGRQRTGYRFPSGGMSLKVLDSRVPCVVSIAAALQAWFTGNQVTPVHDGRTLRLSLRLRLLGVVLGPRRGSVVVRAPDPCRM